MVEASSRWALCMVDTTQKTQHSVHATVATTVIEFMLEHDTFFSFQGLCVRQQR